MKETPRNYETRPSGAYVPARVVVWEDGGKWARHLRPLLATDEVRVHEARTARLFREMIAESPASIAIVQWTARRAGELATFAAGIHREFPEVRIVAVADRPVEALRRQVLETGVAWLCTSPRALGPVVEIVRRHLARVPEPERTPEQRIWDELPWSS